MEETRQARRLTATDIEAHLLQVILQNQFLAKPTAPTKAKPLTLGLIEFSVLGLGFRMAWLPPVGLPRTGHRAESHLCGAEGFSRLAPGR